jgi:hypothetical protein
MTIASRAPSTPLKCLRALDARMVFSTPTQPMDSRGVYQVVLIIMKLGLECMEVKHLTIVLFYRHQYAIVRHPLTFSLRNYRL